MIQNAQSLSTDLAPGAAPASAEPSALIANILDRYHRVHLEELPKAVALARHLERTHAQHSCRPAGLADHLATLLDDLQGHQHKEEAVLFPMMLAGGSPMIHLPVARMVHEHDDVEAQLVRLVMLTRGFTPPPDACSAWRALMQACAKLDADLREHMRLENEALFPIFLQGVRGGALAGGAGG